jgi:hypothetical protein
MRKSHRLKVLKSRLLWNIFGRKREEVAGDWRKLWNCDTCDLYFSPNVIWEVK